MDTQEEVIERRNAVAGVHHSLDLVDRSRAGEGRWARERPGGPEEPMESRGIYAA